MLWNQHTRDWVAALRSGDYDQGTSTMKIIYREVADGTETRVKYCCMGVAAELARCVFEPDSGHLVTVCGVADLEPGQAPDPDDEEYYACELPGWLSELLGLHGSDERGLAALNDTYGRTFEEIALVIETSARLRVPVESAADILGLRIRRNPYTGT